ncbi:hypothetical protein [Deinococcus fonticola]|uniref:hypothetical protein n=1 Tax=Deinococcus fonticola TaxID=2528713 RepID=UPI001074EB00|nr:hypothetical protein [Deinococcus fonticola]
MPHIRKWPVRHPEFRIGTTIRDISESGAGEAGLGQRGNWIPTGSNTVRYLQVIPAYRTGPGNSWPGADGNHYGTVWLKALGWRVVALEVEGTGEDHLQHAVIAEQGGTTDTYLLNLSATASGADDNQVIISDLGLAYNGGPLPDTGLPGIAAAEPTLGYAVELLEAGWRIHLRLEFENASWHFGNDGQASVSLRIEQATIATDIDLDGNVIGSTMEPRVYLATCNVTTARPTPPPGYLAVRDGRLARVQAWLDELEAPDADLTTALPDVTRDKVKVAGPSQKIGSNIWRVPVESVRPLLFAGELGSVTPTVNGRKLISYDASAVWLQSAADPTLDAAGQPLTELPASNPGYPSRRRYGVRQREAAPVMAYWATQARELVQLQPSTATLTDLTSFTQTAGDLSEPWYEAIGNAGDGYWQLQFQLPTTGWDMWCLMVVEAKSTAVTAYQQAETQIRTNLTQGAETVAQAGEWHLLTGYPPQTLTVNYLPARGKGLTGLTLILARTPADVST